MNKSIDTLKTLADTTCDSIQGYKLAADKASAPELKSIFVEQSRRREATLQQINGELTRRGEQPRTEGSTAGALHRTWTKVTELFESDNEAATERVEEGEDYIAGKFKEALDMDLDAEARMIVQTAYAEIAEGEKLSNMLEAKYD